MLQVVTYSGCATGMSYGHAEVLLSQTRHRYAEKPYFCVCAGAQPWRHELQFLGGSMLIRAAAAQLHGQLR